MTALLDAHVIIWSLFQPHLLPIRIRALLEDKSNDLLLSHASLWEILAKIGRGKLPLAGTSVENFMMQVDSLDLNLLPIHLEHILLAAALPHHHSDPFDRLLIAQSLTANIPIITADPMMQHYGVNVIWN